LTWPATPPALWTPPPLTASSIFQKLSYAAQQAAVSNAITNPFWTIPPAWLTLTGYVQGQVVSNAGNWYICTTGGTSAGATGPVQTNTGTPVIDGSGGVYWSYIGAAFQAASDSAAPTITVSSANPPSGIALKYYPYGSPAGTNIQWKYVGCIGTTAYAGYYALLNGPNLGAAGSVPTGPSIKFKVNAVAGKFAFGFTNSTTNINAIVNNRYLVPGVIAPASGTPNWVVVDFSSVSHPGVFDVEVFQNGSAGWAGVCVDGNSQVLTPDMNPEITACFIADSIFQGSNFGPFFAGRYCHHQMAKLLGWSNPISMSTGGTGYLQTASSGALYNYLQRVQDPVNQAVLATADVVVLMGSTNDGTTTGLSAQVLATLSTIRSVNPYCIIVVYGIWPANNVNVAPNEPVVMSAVAAFHDPLTYAIPLYAAQPIPMITGSWNNSFFASEPTNSTNSALYIQTGDNLHPPDIGTAYLSWYLAHKFRETVLASAL